MVRSERGDEVPTAAALAWAAHAFEVGSNVTGVRKLTGGTSSAMHVMSLEDRDGHHHRAVLRQWINEPDQRGAECVRRESHILHQLESTNIVAPRVLGHDAEGTESAYPSLLMTFLDGHVELSPRDPDDWIAQMAAMLARINEAYVDAPTAESWLDRDALVVPEWAEDASLWGDALSLVEDEPPATALCFIHHDYQQFNLLWHRGVLRSVVDWVWASTGPAEMDVAHCRLNLSLLYSTDYAERFRSQYLAASGRSLAPWWDVAGLLVYLPGWDDFLQKQAGTRKIVDLQGMRGRVEATLRLAMSRL